MTQALLITNKDDVTTDFVVRKLQTKGVPFYRFNTEEICKSIEVSLDFDKGRYLLFDKNEQQEYNLLSFTDIYYRRPELPSYESRNLSKGEIAFLQTEVYFVLDGIYRLLAKKHWLNNVYSIRNAENKIYQLLLAKQIGLSIPQSLISNSYVQSKAFLDTGKRIVKPVHNARILDEDNPRIVFTTEISSTFDKAQIECSVNYFQEKIEKQYDIRATFVGDKCFAVAIESQNMADTCVDWRKGEHILKHTPIELPRQLQDKCRLLMKRLNLNFSAIDFVLDTVGHYVFLEINPNGQWAWIEHLTGLPISDEIVKQLCRL